MNEYAHALFTTEAISTYVLTSQKKRLINKLISASQIVAREIADEVSNERENAHDVAKASENTHGEDLAYV